jgi:hypothetical protein
VAQDLADFHLDRPHLRTPGYPLLLALTGSHDQPTRALFFVSLLLHFVSIWLLAVVLNVSSVRHGWLVAFCSVLLLPPYVEPAGLVMTENLAQLALVVGFAFLLLWFVHRRGTLLAVSAVAFGYGALTRPAYQALAVVLGACLLALPAFSARTSLSYRDGAKAALALVAGSLLILGSLAWLNHQRFGHFGVTSSFGFHLSTKTMLFVEQLPEEYAAAREILIRERDVQLVKRGGVHTGSQTIWSVRPELAAATGLSDQELSRYLVKMNLTLIRRAPLAYLQEVARSLAAYWFPAHGALANMGSTLLRWLWTAQHGVLVCFFFLQIAVIVGVAAFSASQRFSSGRGNLSGLTIGVNAVQMAAYVLAGAIVFYTMVLSCVIDIGEPRQRRPTDVLVVAMCVLGAHVWRQTVKGQTATPDAV